MADNPMLVSIITVCLNSEETIADAIESVLRQTYKNIEYIIMDGLSSDSTLDIARSYEAAMERRGISYKIFSAEDGGIYDAMNKGIDIAKGEIIGIINSDDYYEDNAVETVVRAYRRYGFDLCFANIRMHMRGGRSFIKKARVRLYTTSRDWNHPTQFVRREVYECFRYRCRDMSDDMDFYFRVKRAGFKIVAINKTLANFRMGGVSSKIKITEIPERIGRRYRIYRENGYSRFYIIECVGFEIIKFLLA